MRPGPPELDGGISRFEMTKTWRGDLQGTGGGVMLSAGDPHVGAAGYVAIETVDGRLDGVQGSFALLQFGSMANGSQTLQYQVAPGSGTGHLAGLTGVLVLEIDQGGAHHYQLEFDL